MVNEYDVYINHIFKGKKMFSQNRNKTIVISLSALLLLSGCSTIDNFLGGGLNDPANRENAQNTSMAPEIGVVAAVVASEPAAPTADQLLAEKDQALIDQGMRLAAAERELAAMQEEKSTLQDQLERARTQVEEKQALLDAQNELRVNNATPTERVITADGGYGLHVASYTQQESIAPGLREINRRIPVLTEGRPIKIASVTVRGRNYYRLIIGQFNSQSEAIAECNQALMLIDFCEVVAFEGQDF